MAMPSVRCRSAESGWRVGMSPDFPPEKIIELFSLKEKLHQLKDELDL